MQQIHGSNNCHGRIEVAKLKARVCHVKEKLDEFGSLLFRGAVDDFGSDHVTEPVKPFLIVYLFILINNKILINKNKVFSLKKIYKFR
jgi:hypothetical protein